MAPDTLTRRRMLTLTGTAAAAGLAGCLGGGTNVTDRVTAYAVPYHWGYVVFDEEGEELDQIEIETGTELTIKAVNDHAPEAIEKLPDSVAQQVAELDPLSRLEAKVESGEFPEPEGYTVEEVYQATHAHGNEEEDHDEEDGHHEEDEEAHQEKEDSNDEAEDEEAHQEEEDSNDEAEDEESHDEAEDGHHDDDDGHHDEESIEGGLDHGLDLQGTDITLEVRADLEEPAKGSHVFDEPGTYQAACFFDCGYYHEEQVEDLVVVSDA